MDFKSKWLSIQMVANKTAKIVISGYIGVPENWQHDEARAKDVVTTKEKMTAELAFITNLKVDTIEVEMDSFGGDVNHGFAIYRALAINPAKIIIDYISWSASAATFIAAAGDHVKAPTTFMGLLHEGRGGVGGTKAAVEAYANFLEIVNETAAEVYAAKSGTSKEVFRSLMAENGGEGVWRTAEDFKGLGLIDEVYEPMRAAASFDAKAVAKEYNINTNTINMILFGNKKPLNSIAVGEVQAAYQGELAAGIEFEGMNGAEVPDTTMEHGGNTLVIEKSILKSITPIQAEMVDATIAATMVSDAVTPIQAALDASTVELVAMTAKRDELQTKYDNLAKLSSTHKPEKIDTVDNTVEMTLEQKIKANTKELADTAKAARTKKIKGE